MSITRRRRKAGMARFYDFSLIHLISMAIESSFRKLFRKILFYLSKRACASDKEALRAGINVIEDVENNTPLKEVIKTRFKKLRGNVKRKAKKKISSLM